jgi:hypothetical protein
MSGSANYDRRQQPTLPIQRYDMNVCSGSRLGHRDRFAGYLPHPHERTSRLQAGMSVSCPITDMSIDAATPGAKDRCGVTRPWGLLPYYRRFTSVVSTCRRPHLSAGTSRCALPPFRLGRQKARQRFGGLPMSVQMANQVHAAINYENSAPACFLGDFLSARNRP